MSAQDFSHEEIKRPESGCILKIKTNGRGFRGLVDYQSARGADMDGRITHLPFYTNMLERTPRDLSSEFSIVRRLRPQLNTCVGHLQICPSRALKSKEDWIKAIDIALKEHDIYDTPFVAYLHAEGDEKTRHTHVHIAFSRIRYDGSVISDSKSYRKNERASRIIEREFQLGAIQERPREKRGHDTQKAYTSMRRQKRLMENIDQQSGDFAQPIKGKHMATKQYLDMIAAATERSAANSDSPSTFKSNLDKYLEEEGVGGSVVFSMRGDSAEIFGYSVFLGDGGDSSKIKGSDISRDLSWPKIRVRLAENAERARRARMRRAWDDADAMAATSMALAKAAKGSTPRATGAALSLGQRAVVRPTAPARGEKPTLSVVKPAGLLIPGYVMARQESPAGEDIFEYRRDGSEEVSFVDAGQQLEILGDAMHDRDAVAAFVVAAKARFGSRLTLTETPDDGHFLGLLMHCAELHGVEVIDGRTQQPLGALQAHKEPEAPAQAPAPVQAPEGSEAGAPVADAIDVDARVEALEDLGGHYVKEMAQLDALDALGLGVPPTPPAPTAGAVAAVAASPDVEIRVVPANDLAGRRAVARRVKALAEALPAVPTAAQADKMSSAQLREIHDAFARLEPAREWAQVTGVRVRNESHLARNDALAIVQMESEKAARRAGEPLPTETTRLAERLAREELAAARHELENLSLADRFVEKVTGTRAKEIERLEGEVEKCARASAAAKRQFQERLEGDEKGKAALAAAQERIDTYWTEQGALRAPWIDALFSKLLGLLEKLIAWVSGAEQREKHKEQERLRVQEIVRNSNEPPQQRQGEEEPGELEIGEQIERERRGG